MSMRKDVYERMRYFVLEKIKPNYSAVARQYDVDPRTVKAAYLRAQSDKTSVVRKRCSRRSKLDGCLDIIEDKYAAGCSARSIYDFIVEKGFTGKYTIVKDYCRRFRKEQTKKATIRVEHTIGLSAQVDWKEYVTMTNRNGIPHTFSIFLYVLTYSKFKFLKLILDQKQDTLFKCLGVRTLFINCHELILRLKAAQEKQHLERVMRRYERYDLLIIDELGYLPISANKAKLLFQLINGRYERKSTIITTNVPLSSWGTVLIARQPQRPF